MANPKIQSRYFAGLSRNTFLLALSSLLGDISTEMLYPVLPIFLTQILKASGSDVGIIEGIAQATQNIIQGFSGRLSDKLQRRKPVALVGYLFAAIAKPLIGFATTWQGVLGARFLDRLGAGARSAPRDALIASSVEPQYRGRAFGLEGLGDNLGAFLGPLLAILLLSVKNLDIRWLFYLAVIPGILAFCIVLLVKEPAPSIEGTKANEITIDVHSKSYPTAYWKFLFAIALFCFGYSSNSFLILQTKSLGASLTTTILIYAGFNLVAALTSYPAGALSDKLGRKNLLLCAFFIFFLTYLGFAFIHSVTLIAVLFALYGMFQGIFRAAGKVLTTDLIPQNLRASGIGWYSTTVGLLQLLASIVAGQLWDKVGHTAVFLYSATFAVVGSIALVFLVRSKSVNVEGFSHTFK